MLRRRIFSIFKLLNYFLHIQARQKIKRKTHYFYLKFSNFIKKRKIKFWFSTTKKQGKKFSIQFPIPCSNILCSNASLLIPREITIDSQRSLFSNCLQASIPLISKGLKHGRAKRSIEYLETRRITPRRFIHRNH